MAPQLRMLRRHALLLLALAPGCAGPSPGDGAPAAPAARGVHLELSAAIPEIVRDGTLHVFVPLPREASAQRILSEEITAPIPGRVEEDALGNRFWHGQAVGPRRAFTVELAADVERDARSSAPAPGVSLSDADRADLAAWLAPTRRVPLGADAAGELDPIRAELGAPTAGAAERARQIYEWVVDNVEYRKTGTGWGNGDLFWACSERYGNCTDFHTLLLALARTDGIPGRFEMGFPVPLDRPSGQIGGYHCWVELWLPGAGWTPLDASEAAKHPEDRELHFGSELPDRVLFTRGRDLRLGPDHQGPPLNYYIHAIAELDGEPIEGIAQTVRYEELP